MRDRTLAKTVARRQLEYIAPTKQERMLEILKEERTIKDIQKAGFDDLLTETITKQDLQRGTPIAQRLVDFLDKQYKAFRNEGLDTYAAKAKVSQLYFGS